MKMFDYANILFTGKKCNSQCYGCIGKNPLLKDLPTNLDVFPLTSLDELLEQVNIHNINDLAFTGTNVDPQLYKHELELIQYVRDILIGSTKLSLHTNGLLALRKINVFDSYDKASISFPSFNPETYERITHVNSPRIKEIILQSKIPIKLSMLVTPYNVFEIEDYVKKSSELGVKRVVIRKLKGREDEFPLEKISPFKGLTPIKEIFGWHVYEIEGVEVTICGFDKSTAKGLFLFSNGRLEEKLV